MPAARIETPASRNSLTKRSYKVLLARSPQPLAWLELAPDDVNVQRVQRPAELGHAVTVQRPRMIDPEDVVLVAVEGDRLASSLETGVRRRCARKAWWCAGFVHGHDL